MCTKNVERILDFNHEIKQLYEINLEDDLRYIKSDVGINATGFIYVIGKYDDEEGIKDFEELLEVDILAPFEKIDDEDSFKVLIDEFDYHVLHGDLLLEIILRINGLVDENQRTKKDEEEIIEIIKDDDSIKNENMDLIDERIDEFLHLHDYESLTADKLTSIINKVIKESRSDEVDGDSKGVEYVEVMKEVDENVEETMEEIDMNNLSMEGDINTEAVFLPIDEPSYREEYTDHILGIREESREFIESVLEDALEETLFDHISNMREVSLIVDENSKLQTIECDCNDSCNVVPVREDDTSRLKDFNPSFEPCFDHFVFYSNSVKEYELQHEKCNLNKINMIENEFNFPLYKEDDEFCTIPIFDGGLYMRKEYSDAENFVELDEYDLEDFMSDLDVLEDDIEDMSKITNVENVENIIEIVDKCENEEKLKEKKIELKEMLLEDILDDTKNMTTLIRYIAVRDGDSYFSLASRYGIDERVLAKHNKYKVLERGCVIEIPLG